MIDVYPCGDDMNVGVEKHSNDAQTTIVERQDWRAIVLVLL